MTTDHIPELDPGGAYSDQGSHWCILLNSGSATRADKRAFLQWVCASPERIAAYIQAVRLTEALSSQKLRWPDTPEETLIRQATQAADQPTQLFFPPALRARDSRPPRFRIRLRFALATIAVAAIVCVIGWQFGAQRYSTALGEQRSVVLADGSVVTLNTSSTIEVRLRRNTRSIHLLTGEGLFQVAHDATRPFYVVAGNTRVRAVGTQFDVDRRTNRTTVTVVEGKVSVEDTGIGRGNNTLDTKLAIPLSAGEGLTLSPRAHSLRTSSDVAAATAWTQRRLVFEHRTLGEVAEEFNRYNRQTIHIDSAALRSQEVTGVFQANDPNSFLEFVAKIPGVTIERDGFDTHVVATN
jgi:transmembrane sensor